MNSNVKLKIVGEWNRTNKKHQWALIFDADGICPCLEAKCGYHTPKIFIPINKSENIFI